MDNVLIKEIQETSKKINMLYKEAIKSNDKQKLAEIEKMNVALMPKMNAMLFGQVKMLVVVIAIFIFFAWVVNSLDPTQKDDFTISLTQNSENYTGFFVLNNSPNSFWYATIRVYDEEKEIAKNETVFFVGEKTAEILWKQHMGESIPVYTDKEVYQNGDLVKIFAVYPPGANITATLNNGTRFYVDLPYAIPILDIKRIYEPQSWFIFSSVLISLFISIALLLMKNVFQKQIVK